MRKTTALLGTGALFAATAGLALPASAQDADAQLSVLHGIPADVLGTPEGAVDVYVNGALTLEDFKTGSLEGPLPLPAGSYDVAVAPPDTSVDDAVLSVNDLSLAGGTSYTATANLDKDGAPALNLFTNDTSAADAGQGKATVRHIAANAEGVEVVVNGSIILGTFNNGQELGPAPLDAGTYSAEVKSGDTVVPPTPADFPVAEGENTIVYAWGDPAADPSTFALAVQSVPLGHSAPSGVPGGESGLAAASNAGWLYAAAAAGIVGIAVAGRRLATSEN